MFLHVSVCVLIAWAISSLNYVISGLWQWKNTDAVRSTSNMIRSWIEHFRACHGVHQIHNNSPQDRISCVIFVMRKKMNSTYESLLARICQCLVVWWVTVSEKSGIIVEKILFSFFLLVGIALT